MPPTGVLCGAGTSSERHICPRVLLLPTTECMLLRWAVCVRLRMQLHAVANRVVRFRSYLAEPFHLFISSLTCFFHMGRCTPNVRLPG